MTNNIPLNAIELADKYGEKINSALEQLAVKVGVGVDYFWPILVNQQRMEGIASVALFVLVILFIGALFVLAAKSKNGIYKNNDLTWYGVFVCLGSVILCLMILMAFVSVRGTITKIINPEYHALEKLAEMIK